MNEPTGEIAQEPEVAGLLARCRERDERAWRELFDAHVDFVHAVSKRLGTPDAEVEDVCQEVFVVVYRKLQDFEHGRFTTWLYRIVANVVNDRHRRRRFRQALHGLFERALPLLPGVATPENHLERREARDVVGLILERMAPKKREVFALYELEHLSGEEIAERVGCRVETVWTRLFYARKDFQELAGRLGVRPGGSA
jgi:RNA polymerase sigma-70 factor (ECF subfamily)